MMESHWATGMFSLRGMLDNWFETLYSGGAHILAPSSIEATPETTEDPWRTTPAEYRMLWCGMVR